MMARTTFCLLFLSLFFATSCSRSQVQSEEIQETEVTRLVEVTREIIVTSSATEIVDSQTTTVYPSGDAPNFEEVNCESSRTMDLNLCSYAAAYQSARELEALLHELTAQYPDDQWQQQMGVGRATFPQASWEELKVPYCEYDQHLAFGGTEHLSRFYVCIATENQARLKRLSDLACRALDEFNWNCDPD